MTSPDPPSTVANGSGSGIGNGNGITKGHGNEAAVKPEATIPADPAATAGLPNRSVSPNSIEDAYVSFIFYCNPAVPRAADTEPLREAFRNPPKSGGKTFETYSIYELVRKFYAKEIKTWTELTIKLGVEPPDPSKDESSQKVTQYGVRLKKWLNSLHVKSFFEYLMGISNDYWTKIPTDTDPTSQGIRDGVALEDDMALRALIPHIRPKRGRKRPDDMEGTPTAQRMRLSPSANGETVPHQGSPMPAWPRSSDAHLSAHPNYPRSAHPGSGPGESTDSPFSQWPASAVTPTMRGSFWDDALEPQSAVTPTNSKLGRQRRGAKNVSSAWKPGGLDSSSGKTRGRPPINRTPIEGPVNPWAAHPHGGTRLNPNFVGTPVEQMPNVPNLPPGDIPNTASNPSHQHGINVPPTSVPPPMSTPIPAMGPTSMPTPVTAPPPPPRTTSAPALSAGMTAGRAAATNPRPGRPSISLQVPERAGGPVRLATPPPPVPPQPQAPPVVMVNGMETPHDTANAIPTDTAFSDRWNDYAKEATDMYECSDNLPNGQSLDGNNGDTMYFFEKIEDRTNVDALLSYFIEQGQESEWYDENGNLDETGGVAEAGALVNAMLENMLRTSTSSQAFLINLAALAGAKTLLGRKGKIFRLRDDKDFYNYRIEWEYRFGHFRGHFNMAQSVPRSMWARPNKDGKTSNGAGDDGGEAVNGLSAEDWQHKYKMLLGEMKSRDREITDLRAKMLACMQRERT